MTLVVVGLPSLVLAQTAPPASTPAPRPPAAAAPQDPAPTALVVRVEGIRGREGVVQIALFQRSEGFPEQSGLAARTATVEARDSVVEASFEEIAPGEWAIAVLHDRNENGRLDRNFLGIPKEGAGASNDAVRFGLPKFDKARITVPAEGARLVVRLKYWL